MQDQRRFFTPIVGATLVALMGCSPDGPPTDPVRSRLELRGALTDAEALIAQAVAGRRVRGEQDDMLRREAELPGFGGFYIDSLDRMVVYMKAGSRIPDTVIRQALVRAYSPRPEPRIQGLMPEIARARTTPGDFSLSELIAIENRIARGSFRIPGYTGVGTSLFTNRVVVGFIDAADVEPGLSAIRSKGIPSQAVVGEAWGELRVSTVSFDQADGVRPTRDGLMISIHNFTQYPWQTIFDQFGQKVQTTKSSQCSIGANARWYPAFFGTAVDYMVTAAHCVNAYIGINGVTGDTVFQPRISNAQNASNMANAVGFVSVNEPWGPGCGVNPADSTPTDYCTDADVMMVAYAPGVSGERKLATSTYEGLNGQSGTMAINNWYPIGSVVTPEWIAGTTNGVHKSGAVTGTTTGQLQLPYTQTITRICWTLSNCALPGAHSGGRQVGFFGLVKVNHAGIGFGDSGGIAFGGNGAPYYALGIATMGGGFKSTDTNYCTNGANCNFFILPWAAIQQSAIDVLGRGTLNPVTIQ
jgi:hypothetical protein